VVATSDNPRSEEPLAILAEIEPGLKASGVRYTVEPDRAAAIRLALGRLSSGDVVLIAGKGHEKEQILAAGTSYSFRRCGNCGFRRSAEMGYGGKGNEAHTWQKRPSAQARCWKRRPAWPTPGALKSCGYSIDSRTVAPGELFLCRARREARRPRLCCRRASKRGAVAAVVSRALVATLPDAALAVPLLITEDPLLALQALAAHVRRQWGKRVVAITGSAGKTTTKEAVAAALGAKFNVLKSQGNLNNGFGLPLQLLRLEPEHELRWSRWA
jgi:UDP-N-acetylmuramyl tripeptide synthase